MWYKKINNENGITMTSLVIYIIILTMVIGILTTISTFFYTNMGEAIKVPKYANEFNKFAMFFGTDVKNYNNATVTQSTIQFEDGPTYKYQDDSIYRNDVEIAKNIIMCKFSIHQYNVNTVTKNIINVDFQIGKDNNNMIAKNVDFTLKYW